MRRFTLLMLVMAGLVASSVSATAAVTVRQFFAYDPALAGGSAIATCDLFGDGKPVVVTGAGPGIGPHVRVFTVDGQELGGFLAYDAGFLGGVHVACAKGLVWTAPGGGGGAHIKAWALTELGIVLGRNALPYYTGDNCPIDWPLSCATLVTGDPFPQLPSSIPGNPGPGPLGTDGSRFYNGANCPWGATACETFPIGLPFPNLE